METDYVDDWYCRKCGAGPLTESQDECPKCGVHWGDFGGKRRTMDLIVFTDSTNDPTYSDAAGAVVFLDCGNIEYEYAPGSSPKKVVSLDALLDAARTAGILDGLKDVRADCGIDFEQ